MKSCVYLPEKLTQFPNFTWYLPPKCPLLLLLLLLLPEFYVTIGGKIFPEFGGTCPRLFPHLLCLCTCWQYCHCCLSLFFRCRHSTRVLWSPKLTRDCETMMSSAEAAEHNRPRPLSYTEQQRMMHVEYAARMQRRSMPPRCNPFAILLLVLSIGMMFIGITMTIIAHWPGATQIGENPLKIAGPVLFGVGGLLTIFCIFLVYWLNQEERHRWDAKLRGMVTNTLWVLADDSDVFFTYLMTTTRGVWVTR